MPAMIDSDVVANSADSCCKWLVYIIEAADGSLYTGITTDLVRRWRQHASGRGARYFRGREPRSVVFVERGHDRVSASRREAAIKALTRTQKRLLIVAAQKQTAGILAELPAAKEWLETWNG